MTKRDELIALGGVGAKVRELEWHEITAARSDEDPSHEPTGDYEAVSSIGIYFIEMYFGSDSYGWSVSLNIDFVSDHDDPCAAKAAAQADYEQRIRSALIATPRPLPSVDEIAQALKPCSASGCCHAKNALTLLGGSAHGR